MKSKQLLEVSIAAVLMLLAVFISGCSSKDADNGTADDSAVYLDGYQPVGEEEEKLTQETELSIVKQPKSRAVPKGSSLTVTVRATGIGLKYQWYFKKKGQSKFSEWIGRTHYSETVMPNDSWNGIQLYCVVGDEFGNAMISDTATITIDTRTRVLAVGDSICRGYRNGERGFVGDLDMCYLNQGVSGATLSTARNDISTIPEQLEMTDNFIPDIIIADGGYNDYCLDAPMGEIPAFPAESVDELDNYTVMGSLQRLFVTMKSKYPDARKFFLITHRVYKEGVYLVNTPNNAGYTQQELHDAIVACCNVYDIGIIDVFNDSPLDTLYDEYRSNVNYTWLTDPGWINARNNNTDYVDADGIHPLTRGYLEYYLPLVQQAVYN